MSINLDSDTLNDINSDAQKLHEIVNNLASLGVGNIVDLPQIVVVGEQSSGKSSVLEALTHVPFPVKQGLCTRFATEFVLRHAEQARIDVSVQFADLSRESKVYGKTSWGENDLAELIENAKTDMGLSTTGRDFSKDVLRVEIEGPSLYPLTLVDLPGLYHVETESQSSQGKRIVEELVDSYIIKKNSIILVVVTASEQLANQSALLKVKAADPERERTLGVITKPDLAQERSGIEQYLRVARNLEGMHTLKHSWHVLRNRSEDEADLAGRDEREAQFLSKAPWKIIPQEHRGIVNFRQKLSKTLFDHIRLNIQGVIDDIQDSRRKRQEELNRLGSPRSGLRDMRSFLLRISNDFQRIARDAVQGQYSDPFFGGMDDSQHKLRALVRNYHSIFVYMLKTRGSKYIVVDRDDDSEGFQDIDGDIATSSDGSATHHTSLPDHLHDILQRHRIPYPKPETITKAELTARLHQQAAHNQGREFPGSPNYDLARQLFREQASPWKITASLHIDAVTLVANAFVEQLLYYIVGPPNVNSTTDAILREHVNPFFEQKQIVLRDKLDELLKPFERGFAVPMDDDFREAFDAKSQARIIKALDEKFEAVDEWQPNSTIYQSAKRNAVEVMLGRGSASKGAEFGTDKIIDTMQIYYELSMRTFIDNVTNLALESCLLWDIPNIFDTQKVNELDDNELRSLAAEPESSRERRVKLVQEIDSLTKGVKECAKLQPHRGVEFPRNEQQSRLSIPEQGRRGRTSSPQTKDASSTSQPSRSRSERPSVSPSTFSSSTAEQKTNSQSEAAGPALSKSPTPAKGLPTNNRPDTPAPVPSLLSTLSSGPQTSVLNGATSSAVPRKPIFSFEVPTSAASQPAQRPSSPQKGWRPIFSIGSLDSSTNMPGAFQPRTTPSFQQTSTASKSASTSDRK